MVLALCPYDSLTLVIARRTDWGLLGSFVVLAAAPAAGVVCSLLAAAVFDHGLGALSRVPLTR